MNTLDRIATPEYINSLGYQLPPKAMRKVLNRQPERKLLATQYRQGELTDTTIQTFVQKLLDTWKVGERFPYEITLAMLAVVLEDFDTDFASHYISSLANLHSWEMPITIRIAQQCLRHRLTIPGAYHKSTKLDAGATDVQSKDLYVVEGTNVYVTRQDYESRDAA